MLPLLYILIFLFGICIGSFLNVVILRVPAGESIVTGPSHCMRCGRRLKWYEMVPVFSFLALRGRCAGCGEKISPQYPLIEAANGLLWVFLFWHFGLTWTALCACGFVSCLLALSVIDARTGEIPVGINICIAVLAVCMTALDLSSWPTHVIGLFAVSGPLYVLWLVTRGNGVGGGDIKLLAASGLLLGWKLILLAVVAGCVVAVCVHIPRMALKKAGRALAFGPYLSVGMLLALLWGESVINWYLRLLH